MRFRILAPCALLFLCVSVGGCHRHHHHHDDHHHHYKLDVSNDSGRAVTSVQVGGDVHDVFVPSGASVLVEGDTPGPGDVTVIWEDGTRTEFSGVDGALLLD